MDVPYNVCGLLTKYELYLALIFGYSLMTYVQLYKHTFVEMIFLHPIAAATRVKAPILSGVRTLSKITVIGTELSFGFSLMAIFISSKSNVAKEKKGYDINVWIFHNFIVC